MTLISHNVQGKKKLVEGYIKSLKPTEIYFLQDVGQQAYNFLHKLKNINHKSQIILNRSSRNKYRSVALIIGSKWQVADSFCNTTGSMIGASLCTTDNLLHVICTYLPHSLDKIGEEKISSPTSPHQLHREEAIQTYKDISSWISSLPRNSQWILAGDLNETRSNLDREGKNRKLTSLC